MGPRGPVSPKGSEIEIGEQGWIKVMKMGKMGVRVGTRQQELTVILLENQQGSDLEDEQPDSYREPECHRGPKKKGTVWTGEN